MTKYNSTIFLIFLCICIPCLIVFSQEKKDTTQILEIPEVISIGKIEKNAIIPYQKLEGKELETLNSLSVADALKFFSGVQLKDYGGVGGMKTVNIRGMGSQHVGVFYDGIQLGNAQNGTVDLGKFSLDNLESISLYNGQKSEIFQPAKDFGSASSIYLKSKIPQFKEQKKTNLSMNYRSGSFNLINPSINWEQKLSESLNSSLNFEYVNSNGKYKFRQSERASNGSIIWDTTAIRQNGNINAFRAEAGLFGKLSKGIWNIKAYYYDSERQIPGAIVKNVYHRYEKQWDRNFFIQGSLEKKITSKYKFSFNAKYAYDHTHYLQNDIKSKYINNTFKQKEFYFSWVQQYSFFSFWDASLSADYQYNSLDADLPFFAFPDRNSELIAAATSLHFSRFKFQASLLGTYIQEKIKKTSLSQASPNKKEYTPSVFIYFKPFRALDFDVHAFYKRIFRMPTFNDLYYTDFGNSLLRPEYTTQYDAGINYSKYFNSGIFYQVELETDVYYNEVRDKIIAYPKGQQFRWTMLNLGKVRIRGIDISALTSYKLYKNLLLNLKATYTYEDAQDISSPTLYNYKNQIPYIPWNSGSLLISILYKKWNLNYSFIYTGERYNQPANIPANYEKEWYTHDFSLTHDISLKIMNLKAGIEINNIFNKQYAIVRNYPMPGRNYRLSLKINI
ncbi:TonB-dependent receptor [Apibacter adventoris]|uniref:TonB-dependent receptor n=1 Tax=Apibacter adventoris TaxID=1679466 RepID=UPI0015E3AF35|nr:TonB-dependent receptor plug domain-containing protein [Apibacter adventoris]